MMLLKQEWWEAIESDWNRDLVQSLWDAVHSASLTCACSKGRAVDRYEMVLANWAIFERYAMEADHDE